MKIKDKPDYKTKPKPITFKPDDTVRAALDVMCAKNIGSVIITDNQDKIKGIVTERDMMIRVLGASKNPDKTKIADIMSTEVRCANENDELSDWLRIMSNERFRHLPIVDVDGKLVNMMSQGDFVAYTWPDLFDRAKEDMKSRYKSYLQIGFVLLAALVIAILAMKL